MQKIRKWINGLSVKAKLIIYAYAIFTPVLILICGILMVHNYKQASSDRLEGNRANVESLAENISLLQSDVKDYTTYICINQEIRGLLSERDSAPYNADARLWQNNGPMEVVQDMISMRGEIKTIAIYPENGIRPYLRGMDGSVNLSTMEDIRQTQIYQETVDTKLGMIWKSVDADDSGPYLANFSDKVVLCREIYDLSHKKRLGFIVIGVGKSKFEELMTNMVKEGGEAVMVVDPHTGELVTVGDVDDKLKKYLTAEEFRQQDYREREKDFIWGDYEVICTQRNKEGAITCKIIPRQQVQAQIRSVVYMPLALLFGLLIGMFPFFMIISNLVTNPLRKVSEAILKFSAGDFEQQVKVETNDEVGQVAECFNAMVGEIKKLIDENYVITLSEKESELAALQAQINPHFLYNTLDSLYWQATEAGNDEIAESILSLSSLFRLTLNQGRSIITVEKEFELVREYLKIQKMRFPRKLNYELYIADEIKDAKIPKLIIQPFVENAIVHGFENVSKPCKLTITGTRTGDRIHFEIKDTGVGMKQEQIHALWENEPVNYSKQRIGRYAIKNIRERLQLKYHEQYILKIESTVGEGTTVILEIPFEEGD